MRILIVLLAVLASGCAYTHTTPGKPVPWASGSPRGPLCVMSVADGHYGDEQYPGSGREVSQRTLAEARGIYPDSVAVAVADEREAIRQCAGDGLGLLLAPAILHWENHATEWNFVRDWIKVELRLVQVPGGKLLRRSVFEARNSAFQFIPHAPDELLDEDFSAFVRQVIE